ncbi:inosine-uridine preferring nucleoside hydrolase [Pontibacillus halophilus JSM 076056 = DSM 19796]|uniref:Inosine-uridine preferring nucleoside hydrolase n=1 Tax=Pontibacillus halophilus JSM 076056 = DSM 19796 TaxID=1385510 RepID=A0A0A5GLF7_9BACI|nr:nucleoside hydrolase [Pontibacillus halophilus]KGX92033.1 inosine-uridine preferring nucleoside hydrolase [Pontibacillus halophilus JSM 076056 = DSM 19796]
MGKKVLFFADFGIDDVLALVYAFFEEEIDIVAVVTGYGNIPRENAKRNALFIRSLANAEHIPIIEGASKPYTGKVPDYVPEIHGDYGLGPFIPSEASQQGRIEDFHYVRTLFHQYEEDDIYVVNVGRLSSLATFFVLYPEYRERIKDVYIMGGAFLSPGNVTPVAEANIHGDPYAAHFILTVGKPMFIVPLNVTQYAYLPNETAEYIKQYCPNPIIKQLFKPMFDYYFNFYKSKSTEPLPGPPLHDVLALWSIIAGRSVTFNKAPVKVVTQEGEAFGQTIGDFRQVKDKADYPAHYVAIGVDYPTFLNRFVTQLTRRTPPTR